jgi:hypothetical protein
MAVHHPACALSLNVGPVYASNLSEVRRATDTYRVNLLTQRSRARVDDREERMA